MCLKGKRCCLKLETGFLIWAYFQLVTMGVCALTIILLMARNVGKENMFGVHYVINISLVPLAFIGFKTVFFLCLLFGVTNKKSSFVLPYLIFYITETVLKALVIVVLVFTVTPYIALCLLITVLDILFVFLGGKMHEKIKKYNNEIQGNV